MIRHLVLKGWPSHVAGQRDGELVTGTSVRRETKANNELRLAERPALLSNNAEIWGRVRWLVLALGCIRVVMNCPRDLFHESDLGVTHATQPAGNLSGC
jgi:hypothetical protein